MAEMYSGGCQCGAVRYRAEGPRDRASLCYCRMCQLASGGPFMAFVRFPVSQVEWSNPPAVFASSNIVERGFCGSCGTPLSYQNVNGCFISLTIHSLDHPEAVTPEMCFSLRSRPSWCVALGDLSEVTETAEGSEEFVNYQYDPEPLQTLPEPDAKDRS